MAPTHFENVVENIIDQVFLDKIDEHGVQDWERLPKNFLKMALVSRTFLIPVRRNVCSDLRVEGPERFLLLTGQLRFSPHLANLVKAATLATTCMQRTHIDEKKYGEDTPGSWEPRAVSATALRLFLDACPHLTTLSLGPDFIWALSVQDRKAIRLTDVILRGCFRCPPQSIDKCSQDLGRGWLKPIVSFPHLKELDISDLAIGDGPATNATLGIQSGSYNCTGLNIPNMRLPTTAGGLSTLLRAMPALRELVLDGLQPMPRGELKKCLSIVSRTLTLLTITDYHSGLGPIQPWEDDVVTGLPQLTRLALNGVPITPGILNILPPRLEHLRFSKFAVSPHRHSHYGWGASPFVFGRSRSSILWANLPGDSCQRGLVASKAQLAELVRLCRKLELSGITSGTPSKNSSARRLQGQTTLTRRLPALRIS